MTKPAEIPASEVRGQISEVISRVAYGGERVIISRNGKAQVAVVPLADLDRLKQLDEQRDARRRRAAQAVADIQEESARSGVSKLSDEDIDAEISEARKARRRASSPPAEGRLRSGTARAGRRRPARPRRTSPRDTRG